MCLMVPGRITRIEYDAVTVDYGPEKREGKIIGDGYKVGDWVVISGGIVVQKIPEKEARDALKLYKKAAHSKL